VQRVHAALVFEHAGVGRCLENALRLVASGGALHAVLQLPSEMEQDVARSQFSSVQELKSDFSLINPMWLSEALEGRRFHLTHEMQRSLTAGKAFWMGLFGRE